MIETAIGSSHVKHIDRLNRRQVRKLGSSAVYRACRKLRAKGVTPLTAVDDLSVHALGPWVDDFAYGLTSAALREGISISGGEMAQMGSSYYPGAVGVVVYVTGIRMIPARVVVTIPR